MVATVRSKRRGATRDHPFRAPRRTAASRESEPAYSMYDPSRSDQQLSSTKASDAARSSLQRSMWEVGNSPRSESATARSNAAQAAIFDDVYWRASVNSHMP